MLGLQVTTIQKLKMNHFFHLSGFSIEALHDWGTLAMICIHSILMLSIEWWAFEVMSVLAGKSMGVL